MRTTQRRGVVENRIFLVACQLAKSLWQPILVYIYIYLMVRATGPRVVGSYAVVGNDGREDRVGAIVCKTRNDKSGYTSWLDYIWVVYVYISIYMYCIVYAPTDICSHNEKGK